MTKIIYKIKTATAEEIYFHLKECNANFIPPLDEKVDLWEYSKKIAEKSITFEAWEDKILAGLIAAYLNDKENKSGYITNVSTVNLYKGKGIASELLKQCIAYSKKEDFKEILLEVSEKNRGAIQIYRKFGFMEIENKKDELVMKLELNKFI